MISYLSYKQILTITIILIISIISCATSAKANTIEQKFSNNFILNPYNLIQEQEANKLIVGKPIERELAEGQTHTYSLYLEANQFVSAVVTQTGIDVIVRVYNPANEKIYEMDSPNGTQGDAPVYFISKSAGDYRLEVSGLERTANNGKYFARLIEQCPIEPKNSFVLTELKNLYKIDFVSNNNLEDINLLIGKYQETLKVLNTTNLVLTKADLYDNLASLYLTVYDLEKSEEFFLQALEIYKKFDPKNIGVAKVNRVLSELCIGKGELAKAELLLLQALEIYKEKLGHNNTSAASCMNTLGRLYIGKTEFTKAEFFLLKSLEITERLLGVSNIPAALCISHLGSLYGKRGDYTKAEAYLLQALEIIEKIEKVDDSYRKNNTVFCLVGLAKVYIRKKDYAKAETRLLQVLELYKETQYSYINYTGTIITLGYLNIQKGEFTKAEKLLFQILEDFKNKKSLKTPNYVATLIGLESLYYRMKNYERAVDYGVEVNQEKEIQLIKNLFIGSERSKQLYLQTNSEAFNHTLSLHLQTAQNNLQAAQSAFTEILRRKGRSIDATSQNLETLRKKSSPESLALLNELAEKKKLFSDLTASKQSNLPSAQRQQQLKVLEDEIDKLEYKISEYSLEFRIQSQPITLQTVQQAIPKDFVLVEFAYYHPHIPDTLNYAKPHYAVYLSDNQGVIKWADLGSAETIDKIVDELRENLSNRFSKLKDVKLVAKRLDEKIMKPVRKLAGQKNHFLIAPDGKLNLVPFAALVNEKGRFLIENNQISYLTSGRDLLRFQNKVESKQAPVIVGNPDFGPVSYAKEISVSNKENIWCNLKFKPLPASEEEAKAIKELFPESKLLTGKQATEEAINNINAPLVLHFATHGFFLKEEKPLDTDLNKNMIASRLERSLFLADPELDSSFKIENPLLRSGIALAGANTQETTKGIFTAFKATSLNLLGTKLVVVSTCGSGLGEVKTGDGVYGLRRALLLAGSETQVISLWNIADKNTKDLMINYYTRLKKGDGRASGLRQTQLGFLRNPDTNHPYYWASFIQSGEWANLSGQR